MSGGATAREGSGHRGAGRSGRRASPPCPRPAEIAARACAGAVARFPRENALRALEFHGLLEHLVRRGHHLAVGLEAALGDDHVDHFRCHVHIGKLDIVCLDRAVVLRAGNAHLHLAGIGRGGKEVASLPAQAVLAGEAADGDLPEVEAFTVGKVADHGAVVADADSAEKALGVAVLRVGAGGRAAGEGRGGVLGRDGSLAHGGEQMHVRAHFGGGGGRVFPAARGADAQIERHGRAVERELGQPPGKLRRDPVLQLLAAFGGGGEGGHALQVARRIELEHAAHEQAVARLGRDGVALLVIPGRRLRREDEFHVAVGGIRRRAVKIGRHGARVALGVIDGHGLGIGIGIRGERRGGAAVILVEQGEIGILRAGALVGAGTEVEGQLHGARGLGRNGGEGVHLDGREAAPAPVRADLVAHERKARGRAPDALVVGAEVARAGVIDAPVLFVHDLEEALAVDSHVRDRIARFQAALLEDGADGFHLESHAHLADGYARVLLGVPPVADARLALVEDIRKEDALVLVADGADIGEIVGRHLHALGQALHAGGADIERRVHAAASGKKAAMGKILPHRLQESSIRASAETGH